MRVNIYPLLIICCILLRSSKSKEMEVSILECEQSDIMMVHHICKPPEPGSYGWYKIPADDLADAVVEYLMIYIGFTNSTWYVTKPDELKKLSYLKILHINLSHEWLYNPSFPSSEYVNTVFSVPSLEMLVITYSKWFNKTELDDNWTLTDNLKHLYMENSATVYFNLTTSNYLQSLSLVNCSLKNIPENKGLYYLTNLDLRNNRLENMTVLDIASFCSLKYLDIADAEIGNCECRKIMKLFYHMYTAPSSEKFTVEYNCNPSNTGKCPTYDWEEVMKKRKLCLETVSSDLTTIVIVFIVLGVSVITGILTYFFIVPRFLG